MYSPLPSGRYALTYQIIREHGEHEEFVPARDHERVMADAFAVMEFLFHPP